MPLERLADLVVILDRLGAATAILDRLISVREHSDAVGATRRTRKAYEQWQV
jgi:hypothetical protein